ncbi:hypothetical protein AX17_005922 [Amanita inopinata Kibby_2008]|nr:hypothetical protein AX17_005922 [Amanita inopinata Kibby_2008]
MHSNRLKRKLGELGIDTSSKRANESFCLIGTPLPPLEKSKDTGEFVPLWQQEVRDEKGRRRLHGAFTGGFSAGYFNTVGSKEGWTPSTFVSSRSDRAKKKASRPEDFMDEEDLQEIRDGMKLVDTTEETDLTGGTEAELQRRTGEVVEKDPIASVLEASILPAPKDSAGVRILRRMGWKPGQGIGPRITYRQRKLEDLRATTEKALSLADIVINEEEEEASKHMYPRRDTPLLVVKRKDNSYGLGYFSGPGLHEMLGESKADTGTGPRISAGFGLGALNEAEEDDIDVYDSGHDLAKSRIAYDMSERDGDTITIGQARKQAEKKEVRPVATHTTFSTGLRILPGFELGENRAVEDRWFDGPEVPKGWTPNPKCVWDSDPNKENIQTGISKSEPLPYNKWRTGITADERRSLLGEEPVTTAPRSVFEYMSQEDRERLQGIAAGIVSGSLPPKPPDIRIPRTEPQIAQAALQGFQPFTSDPSKQERYTAYLLSQADPNAATPELLKPLHGQRIDEFNKELEDYAKAATLFKPISGAMAGRFTSATIIEQGPKVHEGLHTPSAEEIERKEAEKKMEEEKLTPQQHAAKLGMYGPMTREVRPWQPARLLCKRFGVKEPELLPETNTGESAAGTGEQSWQEQAGLPVTSQDTTATPMPAMKRDLDNIGLGEDDSQGKDTLTYERPSMDMFKAIFASDEEDSDDEVVQEEEEEEEEGEGGEKGMTSILFPDQGPTSANVTNGAKDEGPIDLNTFKPTFIPRDKKSKAPKDKDRGKGGKKEKKDREKKKDKKTVLVSFEMDEGGDLMPSSKHSKDKERVRDKDRDKDKERPKKKRRDRDKPEDNGDDGMCVDGSEPVETMSTQSPPLIPPIPPEQRQEGTPSLDEQQSVAKDGAAAATTKGRKRAIDFM